MLKLETFKQIFEKYSCIKGAFLFGSYAEGKEKRNSDVDIALVFDDNYPANILVELQTDLIKSGIDNCDLSDLNSANPVLRHSAVRLNKLIYKRADFDSASYVAKSVKIFLDLQYLYRVQREILKEKVLNGKN